MPVRTILTWPDPRLSFLAEPITAFDNSIVQLATDVLDSMKVEFGAGLAATQVGITKSLAIIAANYATADTIEVDPILSEAIVLINPKIDLVGQEKFSWEEACLSVPNYSTEVERHKNITLEYQDLTGKFRTVQLTAPFSGIVQHEVDHLVGKLYLDRLSASKRRRAIDMLKAGIRRQKRATLQKNKAEKIKRVAEKPRKGFRTKPSQPKTKSLSKRKRRHKKHGQNKCRKKK